MALPPVISFWSPPQPLIMVVRDCLGPLAQKIKPRHENEILIANYYGIGKKKFCFNYKLSAPYLIPMPIIGNLACKEGHIPTLPKTV